MKTMADTIVHVNGDSPLAVAWRKYVRWRDKEDKESPLNLSIFGFPIQDIDMNFTRPEPR